MKKINNIIKRKEQELKRLKRINANDFADAKKEFDLFKNAAVVVSEKSKWFYDNLEFILKLHDLKVTDVSIDLNRIKDGSFKADIVYKVDSSKLTRDQDEHLKSGLSLSGLVISKITMYTIHQEYIFEMM